MDREPEDLQFLGIVGIGREAFKIHRSCAKLLGALTLTLVHPLSFAILGHQFVSDPLFDEMRRNVLHLWEAGSPARERTTRELTGECTKLFVILAAYAVLVLAFSLLSTAAVVYTVASMYSGKEVSYARVMSIVPRVWKRLMVTFLWFFIVFSVYYTASVSAFLLLVYAGTIKGLINWSVFLFGMIFISAVFFCVHVYISMVWHLACVISVLEDKYGLGAMRKSKYLIKGKRITALALDMLYLIFGGIIAWFFEDLVVYGDNYGPASSSRRGAYGVLLVSLLCFVNLIGLLIQSVFYFVCKSYHHENIDKSSLSDHMGDYEPLKSSSIQLEDLHGSV